MVKKWLRAGTSLLLVILLGIFATACGVSEEELSKYKTQGDRYLAQGLDPEGYSKGEVFKLSDREQYELFKKRYERAYEVAGDIMTEAAGPDQEWKVSIFGISPQEGDQGQNPLPRGAKQEDAYTFHITLITHFDEPIDYQAAVEKMQAWMVEQDYNTSNIGDYYNDGLQVHGLTQDGIQTWFIAGKKNFMRVSVFPGPYWGNADKLRRLVGDYPLELQESYSYVMPYEFMPFPPYREDYLK